MKQETRLATDRPEKLEAFDVVMKALRDLTQDERARVLNAALEFFDIPRDPKREWR